MDTERNYRLTPAPKREQHDEQVGVVDAPVAVDIHPAKTRARLSEGEQHRQQVSVIDAAVAVNIAVVRRAGRRVEQERLCAIGRGVVAPSDDKPPVHRDCLRRVELRAVRQQAGVHRFLSIGKGYPRPPTRLSP